MGRDGLVTHMYRLGCLLLMRSSTKSSTSLRSDGAPVVSGHSSKVSIIMYIGTCLGRSSMFVRCKRRLARVF